MTTSRVAEVSGRTQRYQRVAKNPYDAIALVARGVAASSSELRWPSTKYQTDPVAFVREVLGDKPWSAQVEILEAVRDYKRVAVKSGHKIGKSRSAASLALWFYCSFPDARVVMSSTTSRQVDQILWRELRKMRAGAKYPIDGDIHELARSGFKAWDFREVVGFTAREAEAVAGISGGNLLYLIDEASGVPDLIFEAIEGNRAGGARLVMFSNPTRTEGEFYEAFNTKRDFYKCITVSSESTPNVVSRSREIPGLAEYEWIEEKQREWGVDSPLYKIRVKGEFVEAEDGKILTVHAIACAEQRWYETEAKGRLCIGVDPAGPGNAGDESAFAYRRGNKVISVYAVRGVPEAAHVAHVLGIIKEQRTADDIGDEKPLVILDREGAVGATVWGAFKAHAELHPLDFDLIGVRASERANREPNIYERTRDELWANCAQWMKDGGAIPEDVKLARQLHAPEWIPQVTGRIRVTPKEELRKKLDRSPDHADALVLCVWKSSAWVAQVADEKMKKARIDAYEAPAEQTFDPYEAERAFR